MNCIMFLFSLSKTFFTRAGSERKQLLPRQLQPGRFESHRPAAGRRRCLRVVPQSRVRGAVLCGRRQPEPVGGRRRPGNAVAQGCTHRHDGQDAIDSIICGVDGRVDGTQRHSSSGQLCRQTATGSAHPTGDLGGASALRSSHHR